MQTAFLITGLVHTSAAFLTALLPVAVLLFIIYRMDKYGREPLGRLVLTFFMGCLVVLPAIAQESVLMLLYSLFAGGADGLVSALSGGEADDMFSLEGSVVGALFNGYVVAGFSEELWKLLFLYWVVWNSPHFDEYFDGIVYAVFISMGFACVENVGYVMSNDGSLSVAVGRALLAVPAHFLFAVSMGYHFSLAKFDPTRKRRHLGMALLVPVLLHGTYDSLLMVAQALGEESLMTGVLALVFVGFDVWLWIVGMRRIRRMQQRSKEQDFDRGHPFDGFTWQLPKDF